jgi:hypothetical protein
MSVLWRCWAPELENDKLNESESVGDKKRTLRTLRLRVGKKKSVSKLILLEVKPLWLWPMRAGIMDSMQCCQLADCSSV